MAADSLFWIRWILFLVIGTVSFAVENPISLSSTNMTTSKTTRETATLGGGCFWCLEAVFEKVKGVYAVTSGYADGAKEDPTYKEVCTGKTGHAEVVQIDFDPAVVSYEKLLDLFWTIHDPTTLNRQGGDVGTQYRSIILHHDAAQKEKAEASIKKVSKDFQQPIVTELKPLKKFYPAEEYHQDYFRNNPTAGYCSVVIAPKVKKVENHPLIKKE